MTGRTTAVGAALGDAALESLKETLAFAGDGASRYEVLERIGEGGMGEVYRALDHELGREVALKVVLRGAGDVSRLHREARILASLEHPGIVPVHDAGTLADGRAFYAMKLVRGSRLDELLAREAPQLGERLRLFERLCETVAFAHAAGVIHRDLKPENVMVGPFGEVLVMDWGVAKLLGDEGSGAGSAAGDRRPGTAHGTVLGTPGYMAPEQERGDVHAVTARSDVFALGALLAFLIAGVETAEASLARLRAIAQKAMSEVPVARYGSAQELAAEVARFREGFAIEAYPEGFHERAARLLRRYRTPLLLVAAYLVMRAVLLLVTGR